MSPADIREAARALAATFAPPTEAERQRLAELLSAGREVGVVR